MKTNWIENINEINRRKYTIPAGWETREQVAECLQCSPDKVADLLKPGVQSGDIERDEFPVWDEKRRMAVRVTCYRMAKQVRTTTDVEDRIRKSIESNPTHTDAQISKNIRGSTVKMIAKVRAEM